jgi:hypothetical protein
MVLIVRVRACTCVCWWSTGVRVRLRDRAKKQRREGGKGPEEKEERTGSPIGGRGWGGLGVGGVMYACEEGEQEKSWKGTRMRLQESGDWGMELT